LEFVASTVGKVPILYSMTKCEIHVIESLEDGPRIRREPKFLLLLRQLKL